MANITTTEVADVIPDLWAAEIIDRARHSIVGARLFRRNYDTTPAAKGDTIRIAKPDGVTVRDKAEGTPITVEAPETNTVDVVINKHKYISWGAEDHASAKALDVGLDKIREGIPALVEAIEADIMAEYANAANDVGSQGSALTEGTILDARALLQAARAPATERAFIVGPESEKDIFTDTELKAILRADARGESGGRNAFEEANIGRLFGLQVVSSQLIDLTAASGTQENNLMVHPGAVVLVTRPLPAAPNVVSRVITDPVSGLSFRYTSAYDIKEQSTIHTVDVLYGVKTVRPEWMVNVIANGAA